MEQQVDTKKRAKLYYTALAFTVLPYFFLFLISLVSGYNEEVIGFMVGRAAFYEIIIFLIVLLVSKLVRNVIYQFIIAVIICLVIFNTALVILPFVCGVVSYYLYKTSTYQKFIKENK